MKISIAISVVILIVAFFFGYSDHARIEGARETHAKLTAEAAALGIRIDPEGGKDAAQVTKRQRADKEAEAREAVKKLIAFSKEMEAMQESGGQPDEATQERITDFMDLMLSLDAKQIKLLIAEFRANSELKEETRIGMIGFAIMTLANDHPEAALSIFTESEDLPELEGMSNHLLSSSLANWASKDPEAALEWVRENGKKNPDLITDDVKASLVKGAAANDLKLGFDLIGELGMKKPDKAIQRLARGVKDAEERTRFVKLLREYSAANPGKGKNDVPNAVGSLADGIVKDGFEAGSKWMEETKLSKEETDRIASTISYSAKSAEKGKWIEWIGGNMSEDKREQQVSDTVRDWTNEDYKSAGEWLAKTPDGPTKHASISGYADAVSKYDPQTATQWALTLPEGKTRDQTMQRIHRNWPKDTPENKVAREAFAAEHGIR